MIKAGRRAIHLHGVQTQGAYGVCGTPWYVNGQSDGIYPYAIQNGDVLSFDRKNIAALSGLWLGFGPGRYGNASLSSDLTDLSPDGSWHHISSDLSSFAGQIVTSLIVGPGNPNTPVGPYDSWYENIVIQSTDGTTHTLFTSGTETGTVWGTCGNSDLTLQTEVTPTEEVTSTTFYAADHLGSAQLEMSASGVPITTSQYRPFGGEITSTASDNHYKFTGKERDAESGLDFFGARYYASNNGRFMSPDQIGILGQKLSDPQQWNEYAYSKNNPLRFTDPSGLYIITCPSEDNDCAAAAKAFEKARQSDLKSSNAKVRAAAASYGDPGKANGVTVKFGDPGKGRAGKTESSTLAKNADGSFRAELTVTIRPGQSGADLAATVGHEGQHVADAQGFAATVTSDGHYDLSRNLTKFQTELKAYEITNAVLSNKGEKRSFGEPKDCDGGLCVLGEGVSNPDPIIKQYIATPNSGYGVTEQSQGQRQFPDITTPNPKPQ